MSQEGKAPQLTRVCLSATAHTCARVKEVELWNYQRLVMLSSMSANAVHEGSSPFRRYHNVPNASHFVHVRMCVHTYVCMIVCTALAQ